MGNNKKKSQSISTWKWIGSIGGAISLLMLLYTLGVNHGENIKNIEIASMVRDFSLKELKYEQNIFRLQLRCDSLQDKINTYDYEEGNR